MRSSKKRSRSNQNRPRTLGNIINRVGSGNNLTLADGETVWLVTQAAGNLEIV